MVLMPADDLQLRLTRLETSFDAHLIQSAERSERQTRAIEDQTKAFRDMAKDMREWMDKADNRYVDRGLYEATTVKHVASLMGSRVWVATTVGAALIVGFVGVVTGAFPL